MDADANWMEPDAPDVKAKLAVGDVVDVKGISFTVTKLSTDEFGKAVVSLLGLSRDEATHRRMQGLLAGRG